MMNRLQEVPTPDLIQEIAQRTEAQGASCVIIVGTADEDVCYSMWKGNAFTCVGYAQYMKLAVEKQMFEINSDDEDDNY